MLLRVWLQNAEGAAFKDRSMNSKLLYRFMPLVLSMLVMYHSASAIKIVVPDQYQDQIEAVKEAEREQREKELQAAKASTEGGPSLKVFVEEANAEPVLKNALIMQSVAEAAGAASEFEDSLPVDQGIISGQIVDKETGEALAGVAILIEGTQIATVTDSDGRYTLGPAPAGEYTVSFIKTGYIEANVTEYQVVGGEVSVFPFAMPPRSAEMSDEVYELQDFTVTAEEANDLMMKLELKFDSDRALDVFSSEDFSKFAASDVADAVKRIAGVSVNDGKFPSVRGLNDRYTVTSLNGMPVPSPDPFRKSPQFDLFPSSLLESIVVSKSATADLSGESTAANFDLLTKRMPEEFFLKVSLGAGWHAKSIDEFRSFDRGGNGYLYTDGAAEANQAPRDTHIQVLARPDFKQSDELGSKEKDAGPDTSFSLSVGNTFEFANDRRLGVVFAGYHKRSTSAILDAKDHQNYDFSGADRIISVYRPPSEIKIGNIVIPIPGGFFDEQVPVPYGDETIYEHQEFEENVKIGGLLGLTYELGEEHSVFFNMFTSRTSDTKVTRDFNGQNPDEQITPEDDLFLIRERLYYVERSLTLGQLGGEHEFSRWIWEPKFNWVYQKARTTQDEPDFRDTIGLYRYSDFPGGVVPESLRRPGGTFPNPRNINSDTNLAYSTNSWRFVQEDEESKRADFDLHPLEVLTIEAGGMTRDAQRSSSIQSYIEGRSDADPSGTTEAGLGPSANSLRNGNNSIRGTSEAEREIDALYLAARYEPTDWAKLNFGYRFEDSIISVDSDTLLQDSSTLASAFRSYNQARLKPSPTPAEVIRSIEADVLGVPTDPAETAGDTISRDLENRVYLPSANLSLDTTPGVQLKLGYYETINRPSFREIAADIFIDTENGDFLAGNPFLQSSTAQNYDFRVEFYPEQFEYELPLVDGLFSGDDMIGISLFRKIIKQPIEFIRPTDQNIDEIPFNNPEGATAEGIEFEFRKNFGFTAIPYGEFLSFGGNLSFTEAISGVSQAEKELLGLNINTEVDDIEDERPLTEQPDRIINLDLTFSNPDWGTSVTLAYNKKSEILESIGSQKAFDAYRGEVERLDLIVSHEFESGLTLRFAVKNVLDEGYETYYSNRAPDYSNPNIANSRNPDEYGVPVARKSVETTGRSFSISASYPF